MNFEGTAGFYCICEENTRVALNWTVWVIYIH